MNLDKEIDILLKNGEIRIGDCCGVYTAVYITSQKEVARVKSDRGFMHVLILLVSEINKNKHMLTEANALYPYSLSIATATTIDRLVKHSVLHCFRDATAIVVEHYSTSMASHSVIPGVSMRTGRGTSLTFAINDLISKFSITKSNFSEQ